jgi:hypothetical protein
MALAIKTLTAKRAYEDITTAFSDHGRQGKTVNCPSCGAEYVLYYGQQLQEEEASTWLEGILPNRCPAHVGWLALEEAIPIPPEDHRRRIERAIDALQQRVVAEIAAAALALGNERERLLLSSAQKEGEIQELREEL